MALDRWPQNSSWQGVSFTIVFSRSFEHHTGHSTILPVPPQFLKNILGSVHRWPPNTLPVPPTTREDPRIFRLPPCHTDTMHIQTSMRFPGFEPRHYRTEASIPNYTKASKF
ncbi:hypothetical protein TNCV_112451 [Trichonephila clavipes]|nr:hypothetical protein TNCV_112451 [Trichonephila clavipes]